MTETIDQEKLGDWLIALSALETDIKAWSASKGWRVEEESVPLEEHALGRYDVRRLRIYVPNAFQPQRFLVAEPVGRNVALADGRVDLIAWPTFDRVRLLRLGDRWKIQTLGGPDWPAVWGPETFTDLATRLVAEP